jgi:alkanesulfonate monooxygenase SsuD/methylene tetrahydromethanopterin reductase-like flavin-dependent oxidoreductase (luciferase family)
VELAVNLMTATVDPVVWSREREAEGWDLISVADHLWTDRRPYPHVWVMLTAVAVATERVRVASAFANNLFRSPVEFAQASLTLQHVSGGRFEAGLGAGWSADELVRTGRRFPPPGERAARYVEALQVVRALFDHGRCQFDGDHYQVDIERIGPGVPVLPPLVGSLGGPRTIREATPLLDRVEVKGISPATRHGGLNFEVLGAIPREHLVELIDAVRKQSADVPLTVWILCSAGDDERTRAIADSMPRDSFFGRFFGPPSQVADAVLELADLGADRVQLSPIVDASYELLADAFRERVP